MTKLLYTYYPNLASAQFAIDTQYTCGFPIRGGYKDINDIKKDNSNAVIVKIEVLDDGILDDSIEYPDNMEIYHKEDILSVSILEDEV